METSGAGHDHASGRRGAAHCGAGTGLGLTVASPAIASASRQVEVIVRESAAQARGPSASVELVGRTVVNQLPVIDGILARLPNSGIATLRACTEVVGNPVRQPLTPRTAALPGLSRARVLALPGATGR